nr:hypothetical protein [Novosphingobium sp. Gsoil 351]
MAFTLAKVPIAGSHGQIDETGLVALSRRPGKTGYSDGSTSVRAFEGLLGEALGYSRADHAFACQFDWLKAEHLTFCLFGINDESSVEPLSETLLIGKQGRR